MRVLGITIPEDKRIEIGLTIIYGIGRSRAHQILSKAKVDYGKRPKELSTEDESKIKKEIEGLKLEGDLRR